MGYAELIETVEKLPPERQAEVLDFAMFLAARCGDKPVLDDTPRKMNAIAAIRAARASFPKQDPDKLRQEFADMRNEWERRE